jgi:DNA polymerase-3 subunit delta'
MSEASTQQLLLSQQISANRLPHAILISGVKGSGKSQLANWLSQVLLCQQAKQPDQQGLLQPCDHCKACRLYQSKTYPDHLTLSTQTRTLGVDDIRRGSYFLEKTAQLGTTKIVLIPDAHKMTPAAANALLKTLEEPTNNSVIILWCEQSERLLATITSRCRLYNIRNQAANQTDSYALTGKQDEPLDAQHQGFKQLFLTFLLNRGGRLELLSQLKQQRDAFAWLENLLTTLVWQQHQQGASSITTGRLSLTANERQLYSQAIAEGLNHDTLWQVYQLVISSNKQLLSLTQANPEFVVEKLLVDIDRVITTTPNRGE